MKRGLHKVNCLSEFKAGPSKCVEEKARHEIVDLYYFLTAHGLYSVTKELDQSHLFHQTLSLVFAFMLVPSNFPISS